MIREEPALIEIIGKEPDLKLRVAVEKRVTDPERRREYCMRDGTHDYRFVESYSKSTTGTSHIYYEEYDVYECRYCKKRYSEHARSWHD